MRSAGTPGAVLGGAAERQNESVGGEAVEEEPDPRFSLANERTYLAWIRTALALIAAGVALDALAGRISEPARLTVSAALISVGALCALAAHSRWRRVQVALRCRRPLPLLRWSVALGYVIAVIGVVLIVFV